LLEVRFLERDNIEVFDGINLLPDLSTETARSRARGLLCHRLAMTILLGVPEDPPLASVRCRPSSPRARHSCWLISARSIDSPWN
jgi:hypothetical protein